MKRQELLRQLDQEVDYLRARLADVSTRLKNFKAGEEEKQRVPKWVRYQGKDVGYLKPNKWYKITALGEGDRFHIVSETGTTDFCHFKSCRHIGGDWEICYDNTPPVEKKISIAEILRKRANKHWAATTPNGYEVLFVHGNIDRPNYVAVIKEIAGDNVLLLVGDKIVERFHDGVAYLG